ncbi:hypothetical protein [Specibacter cremeus]|uniref:hypothetical protein n=1 Tax=Specibacter cremeus TaxID=1629051 RepID=UPI000F7A9E73|nr:hypothetical protein [Specibacter cremeus]
MRTIAAPFVVAAPSGVRIRTRIHPTSEEAAALRAIGGHLGRLYRADLAARVRLGRVPAAARGRTGRKRALTAHSSSRWAGSLTRAVEDQYQLGLRALSAEVSSLRSAVEALTKRTRVRAGEVAAGVRGYRTRAERHQKTRRLAALRTCLAEAERALERGAPSITVGGGRLWRTRAHLEAAGLSLAQWQARWEAARMFLTADGESGKKWGNETIRVDGDGQLTLKVPAPLCAEFGTRLTLAAPAAFTHRGDQWRDRVSANRCVRYDISHDPDKARWYVDASWGYGGGPAPAVETLQQGRVLGVDVNADHLAVCVLDAAGNPVGEPRSIPLALAGFPAETRDGRLRAAITALLDAARDAGCPAVAGNGSAAPWRASAPRNSGTGWPRWPPAGGSGSLPWTRLTPPDGAASTGGRPSNRLPRQQ